MPTTLSALSLPFDEAIQYLADKTNATSTHWTDVWQAANAKAFAVAGAATQALVQDFRGEVAKALEQGTTLAEFRQQFDAIVKKHGWQHTGTPGWRARIIYETNLSMAYSAGRYAQATEPETLAQYPYWQYVHSGALHPRLQHLSWNGLVLRADDAFWQTHYPPNGWRCGCRVRVLSARDLGRQGKSGPDQAPPVEMVPWTNPKTGEVKQVVKGIDPSFDYNPGAAWKAQPVSIPANATLTVPPLKPKPKPKPKPPKKDPEKAWVDSWLAKFTPPPATAHGGNFATALGFEGKFVDSFGFSSKLIGGGQAPKGASAAVKAAYKALEKAFEGWKKTGELPDKAAVEALVKAVNPPPPGLRDPALGHVRDGTTKAMLAPKTTAQWAPVAENAALADQRAAIRSALTSLDGNQRSARESYTGSGYARWNAALRGAGGKVPPQFAAKTAALDRAIEGSALKTDVILHRGSKFETQFPSIESALAQKGFSYSNSSYLSASVQRSTAENFGSYAAKPPAPAVVFTIRAKAGMRAMPGTDYEVEWVFPRGAEWRVLDVEVVAKDRVHILLEPA